MTITFSDPYNGISTSQYDQNGFDDTENLDIHSEIGSYKAQLALVKESGSTITEPVMMATAPSGTVYLFSETSGKIWKRSTAGSYSTVTDNANATGHKGACYFDGFMYYTTNAVLGRFVPDTEASRDDSFGAYTNDDELKPMVEHVNSLSLYIGDGNLVASVDSSGTFSANVLDLPEQFRVSEIEEYGDDIIIGSFVNANIPQAKVYRWDTYSSSFYTPDDTDDVGINTFIRSSNSNIIFAQSGLDGKIYVYDGNSLNYYKEIRGVTTTRLPYGSCVYNGIPYFAVEDKIYSLHRKRRGLDYALNHEFTAGGTIDSIISLADTILVSWTNGSTYGVDKIDTNRSTARATTAIEIDDSIRDVEVKYQSLPSGTSIGIETSVDSGDFTSQTTEVDATRKIVHLANDIGGVNTLKARITLNPNGANTPIIEYIRFV